MNCPVCNHPANSHPINSNHGVCRNNDCSVVSFYVPTQKVLVTRREPDEFYQNVVQPMIEDCEAAARVVVNTLRADFRDYESRYLP